jgi:TPR repeat protein
MASDGDDADAMFALASLLVRGETNETRSDAEVARLYEAAAERGHVKAMVAIADALTYGVGVSRNLAKAESWLRKAAGNGLFLDEMFELMLIKLSTLADLGYEIALLRLAAVLELVDPSPLGLRLACECYERAIALGCADAYRHLGMCLQRAGGATNSARAMECFRAAAECGDAAGMYYLSACLDIQARTANHTHHPTLIRSLSTGVESLAPDDLAEEAIAITLPESAVAQCRAEARMWLQRAAELDYEPALSKLMLDL